MKKITFLSIAILFANTIICQVPQFERDALMALYNSTDGPNWVENTNWGSSNPVSTWHGVTVENIEGNDHVTWLNLPSNGLLGTLSPELVNLTELTFLGLFDNQLSGNLPVFISDFSKLTILALDYNDFTGSIPGEYANLTAMESLYFSANNLTGEVSNIFSAMPNLERLYLGENNLEGNLDLSANENVRLVYLLDNNLLKIDLRNGNNQGLERLIVTNNPELTCIFVDDKNNVPQEWTKDATATYVETQAECDALGTEDIHAISFAIYPNPSKGHFIINTNSDVDSVSIYDISGKQIKTFKQQSEYDVTDLAKGLYLLKIQNNKGSQIEKFLVE
ncbi:T9SS type A sorting domain-containing protein [Aequorivita sp. H23M31]|uniref:T9SS type A sorting domain-containing protein n=1 Tax=Aequorivita ciconiae TaxID=2494375 RepID=A0A410G5X3_9FLAO|nr:T9SS type A sorting domain-containing protein [Aequorivita sp. H23M31]QAA82672.1 T9SS type A sorting domain-containing protein [Aequorivita sp. H23M31]